MPMDVDPVVGAVYEDADGRAFEVIAFDENEATVELRYDDGSVEEIDLDAWFEMDLEEISSPGEPEDDEDDYEEENEKGDGEDYLEEDEDEDEDGNYYGEDEE